MAEAGRNTILTEELFKKIKKSILEGNDLRTTARVCEINEGTFYVWHSDNYLNLADKIDGWKRDYKVSLADKNIDDILKIGAIPNKVTLKVVADMSKFVKETLDKDNYTKRNELTGKDGEEIKVQIVNYANNPDTIQLQTEELSDTAS